MLWNNIWRKQWTAILWKQHMVVFSDTLFPCLLMDSCVVKLKALIRCVSKQLIRKYWCHPCILFACSNRILQILLQDRALNCVNSHYEIQMKHFGYVGDELHLLYWPIPLEKKTSIHSGSELGGSLFCSDDDYIWKLNVKFLKKSRKTQSFD